MIRINRKNRMVMYSICRMRLTGGNVFIIKSVFYKSATHIGNKTEDFICTFPLISQSMKRITVNVHI